MKIFQWKPLGILFMVKVFGIYSQNEQRFDGQKKKFRVDTY